MTNTRFYNFCDHDIESQPLSVIWGKDKESACKANGYEVDDRVQYFFTPRHFHEDDWKNLLPMLEKWGARYIWSITQIETQYGGDELIIVYSDSGACSHVLAVRLPQTTPYLQESMVTIWNKHVLEEIGEDGEFVEDPQPKKAA